MANQYKNEVIYNGQTLISLKDDTIAPEKVLSGETFHDRSGAPQTGSMITHNVYDGLDSSSTDDALSANMGKMLNGKKLQYEKIDLANGATKTFTFPTGETIFAIIVSRTGVSSTTAEGIFIGGAGANNSHVTAIGTPATNLTVSMSGNTLSMTSSTSNLRAIIIYA